MSPISLFKGAVQRVLAPTGYRLAKINRLDDDELARLKAASYDSSVALPDGAREALRVDHPKLEALREAYAKTNLPMSAHSLWNPKRMQRQLEMAYFRGDNVYVWQFRNVREHARLKYYLFAQYVRGLDTRGLLEKLGEDGQFGCWTFDYEGYPRISRDLLDSVNELYFLDRHLQIFSRERFNILDIGAGYGRLAYRTTQALGGGLGTYYCTDAVAESTYLCDYYLRYRNCTQKTEVIPFTDVETRLPQLELDLALNIHSFSEMRYDAIQGWFDRIAKLKTRYLMIVPNDPTSFLSREPDGTQRDFAPLIAAAGFRQIACEPIIREANARDLVGVQDHMFLFEKI